jgi:hypothetical protein
MKGDSIMASYVLDKAYRVTDESGIESCCVVTQGTYDGEAKLPSGANEGKILGVSVHGAEKEQNISIRKLGIAPVQSAGIISAGEKVCVADNQGRIKAAGKASSESGVEVNNNFLKWTAVNPGTQGNNIIIDIVVSGNSTAFSISIEGNKITVNSATDGSGTATTTAAQLITSIAADSSASKMVTASNNGSSDGSGVLADETLSLTGGELGDNSFGVAEENASAEGDIIDVFLTI